MSTRNLKTRDQLLDSTRELLWERGYSATSPRAILDRAAVGQGSMYHYFAGKEELAVAALGLTAQGLLESLQSVLSSEGTAVDRISAYLLRKRDVLRGCPVGRMTGDAEVVGSAALLEIVAATFTRIRSVLTTVIEQGVDAGEFVAGVNPADLADTVLAVIQGGYVLARAAGDAAPFDRAAQGAIGLLKLAQVETRS